MPTETITESVKLAIIVTTAGTQVRAKICDETVTQYAEAMVDGAKFPPVVVFHDGSEFILADGFHRVMAAARNGFKDILADVRKGTKSDALKFALAANAAHGLKRTNADKRRSVELALAEWPKVSDSELGRICAVSHTFVASVRPVQPATVAGCEAKRTGKDGKERKLPAKSRKPDPAPIEPEPPRIVCGPPKPDPTPAQAAAQRDAENLAAFGDWAVELAAIDLALDELKFIRDSIRSGEIESEQLRAAGANLEVTSRKFKTRAKTMTAE